MSKRGIVEEEIAEAESNGHAERPDVIVKSGSGNGRAEVVELPRLTPLHDQGSVVIVHPSLVPKVAEIEARLESLDKERRTLRKLLKIAQEAEG